MRSRQPATRRRRVTSGTRMAHRPPDLGLNEAPSARVRLANGRGLAIWQGGGARRVGKRRRASARRGAREAARLLAGTARRPRVVGAPRRPDRDPHRVGPRAGGAGRSTGRVSTLIVSSRSCRSDEPATSRRALPEPLLLVRELVDVVEDRAIGHRGLHYGNSGEPTAPPVGRDSGVATDGTDGPLERDPVRHHRGPADLASFAILRTERLGVDLIAILAIAGALLLTTERSSPAAPLVRL